MKVIRALSAAVVLLVAVIGVPPLLLLIGRLPDPGRWAGKGPVEILLSPDDGSLLLGLVTIAAWVVWLLFTLAVVVELVNLRRTHPIRIPGVGGLQGVAAMLVIAAVTSLGASRASTEVSPAGYGEAAGPAVSVSAPVSVSGLVSVGGLGSVGELGSVGALGVAPVADEAPREKESTILAVHTVAAEESLWDIAAQYYGDGGQWRQIALANPILQRHGPDALEIGWQLVVPRAGAPLGPHLVVREGDTLSSLAEEHLGAAHRWPELYEANRAVLSDPDELAAGTVLRLPDQTAPEQDRSADEQTPDEQLPDENAPDENAPDEDLPDEEVPDGEVPDESDPVPPVAVPPVTEVPGGHDGEPTEVEAMSSDVDPALLAIGFSGMTAAAVVGALSVRRALQLHQRPVGRRISHPGRDGAALERALGHQQTAGSLGAVDRAMRLIAAHCRAGGHPVPPLGHIEVNEQYCTFHFRESVAIGPPEPFRVDGPAWTIDDVPGWLASEDPAPEAPHPWPATVGLGILEHDHRSQVLVNLESWGALGIDGPATDDVTALMGSVACELAFRPWTSGVRLTVLGRAGALPWLAGLDLPELRVSNDPDQTLARIERDGVHRTAPPRGVADLRLDPTLAEAWCPEIVMVTTELTEQQLARLQAATRDAAVVAVLGHSAGPTPLTVTVLGAGRATVTPGDWTIQHHRVGGRVASQLSDLLTGTAGPTDQAFWWAGPWSPRRMRAPDEDTPTASILGMTPARGVLVADRPPGERAPTAVPDDPIESPKEVAPMADSPLDAAGPLVLLLGPIDLVGVQGAPPPRARLQCIEYAAWLLEHPGSSALRMAQSLLVAEGTRRSNMSRLRSWLGDGDDGPFLPDAYSGRISLSDAVSSDWDRVQALVEGGVNRVADASLLEVLEIVRGAPLADAAPGQWHWAEEMRTDMISLVRDVGVEAADRLRGTGDLDRARWAVERALCAAPEDELLLGALIRIEDAAGNRDQVQQLARQIVQRARSLGVDLQAQTVALLQVMIEGQVRSRSPRAPSHEIPPLG